MRSLCRARGCFNLKSPPGAFCAEHRQERHESKLAAARAERSLIRDHNHQVKLARVARKAEYERARAEFDEAYWKNRPSIMLDGLWLTDDEWREAKARAAEKKRAAQPPRWGRMRQATPKWADLDAIAEVYVIRDAFNRKYPQFAPFHVDHIYPIAGMDVCGLHVAENLRIIPGKENSSKHNKVLEEKPRISGTLKLRAA